MSDNYKYSSYGRFIMVNAVVAMLLSCRYFMLLPELPGDGPGRVFLLLSTFSQMALLSAAMGLLLLPLLWLPARARRWLISAGAALAILLLLVDTVVFAQYRFHINAVVLELIMAGQIVSFPLSMWLAVIGGALLVWLLEFGLLLWLESRARPRGLKIGRWFALGALGAFIATNVMNVWASAHVYQSITQVKRYLPLFYPATANSMMRKNGWINEEALERQKLLTLNKQTSDLSYPLAPLQKKAVEKPVNIVFLVIDSWRADTFNADNTPSLWRFAQSGMVFNKHISTGNATRIGIFGLFYSLPGNYWHSVIDNSISPLFMDRLQELDYQLGIFASAQLKKPEFHQTVFSKVADLRERSKGETTVERDREITAEWLQWFQARDRQRPSFSFLFYDAPHGYEFPQDYPHRYEPLLEEANYLQRNKNTDPIPWLNRYKTSVHFTDSLAKQVLDQIKASGELGNTVVVITGDHGEEINDNGLNYWGHNSNFSDVQVQVPFVLAGPGIAPGSPWQDSFSSHADLVPTLMKNYLGVESPLSDYSTGVDLLGSPVDRAWLLASGYSQYAVLTKNDIVEVGSVGQYQHVDKHYRPLTTAPDFSNMQQALELMRRFSK
ncbi:DUF3413 domain-containing protein [Comamonas composti]|uniref:DUF3413 domain-containing protein n=1 Tax=Comamonas composti TaxID=408558 RepID=UPI000427B260|nr:DUF3413 domain-containing protein [Comamonas composti]